MSEGSASLPGGFAARLRLAQWQIPGGLVLALVDVVVVEIAIVLSAAVVSSVGASGWTLLAWDPVAAVTAATALLVANIQLGLYDTVGQGPIERFRLRLRGAALMPWPTLTIVVICGGAAFPAATVLALGCVVLMPLGLLGEVIARDVLLQRKTWGASAVLVGSDAATARLAAHLLDHPELGLNPIGRIGNDKPNPDTGHEPERVPRLGAVSDIERFARIAAVAIVSLSADMPPLEPARLPFRRVIVVPDVIGLPALWLSSCGLGEVAGFAFSNRTEIMAKHRIKRLFDLCIAVPALIVTLPVIGALAVLIKLVSPGPAFYTQQRVGLWGTPIGILKLRSMHVDAERRLQDLLSQDPIARCEWDRHMKLSQDPRVLPVLGNFLRWASLDELPQLWNVIRGEISLVGPRPFPAYHVDRFGPAFQALRARVKPGLTGLWQVTYRSNSDLRQQEAIDTFYIQNWSLWLDLYIVVQTLPALLSAKGAR
jgi:Undecaprenyl-phosphate galactose phosphotransferase WbaP